MILFKAMFDLYIDFMYFFFNFCFFEFVRVIMVVAMMTY